MDTLKLVIVDDEPLIRKAIKYELSERHAIVECRQNDDGEIERKEVVVSDTYGSGPQLFAALNDGTREKPDYILLDMEFQGEPTGGIAIADKIHRQYLNARQQPIRIIIFSGRFDNPLPNEGNREQRMCEVGGVIFEALRKGASAFVSKNAVGGFSIDNILQAIASQERGERYFFNYPVMMTLKEAAEAYFDQQKHTPLDEAVNDEERQILLLEAAGCTAQEIANRLTGYAETDKSIQDKQKELSRKLNIVNKSGARIARAIQCGIIALPDIQYLKRT